MYASGCSATKQRVDCGAQLQSIAHPCVPVPFSVLRTAPPYASPCMSWDCQACAHTVRKEGSTFCDSCSRDVKNSAKPHLSGKHPMSSAGLMGTADFCLCVQACSGHPERPRAGQQAVAGKLRGTLTASLPTIAQLRGRMECRSTCLSGRGQMSRLSVSRPDVQGHRAPRLPLLGELSCGAIIGERCTN